MTPKASTVTSCSGPVVWCSWLGRARASAWILFAIVVPVVVATERLGTGIASEIGHLFGLEENRMVRYDDDRAGVVVASSAPTEASFPVGSRSSMDADSATSRVFR